MYVVGLDVGTTACKALVFSPEGEIEGYGFQEYGILSSEPDMAEQNPEEVWQITCEVLKSAVEQATDKGVKSSEIKALSLSVQGDAVIPVLQGFTPVYNAVLGMDYRSQQQVEACSELLGDRCLFNITGMRPHPINSLIKILWLKENKPEAFAKTWKMTTYADFILGKLGADPVIDLTMASRTMAFDLHKRRWADEILDRLDIDPDLFSTPVPSGTDVGRVSKVAAELTGLPVRLRLVTGGHDQTYAALGAGVIDRGTGVVSTGTAEVFSTAFDTVALNDQMFQSYYPCYLYVKPEMYFTFSLNHVGGLLLRWYRDNFATVEVEEARASGIDPYNRILEKVPQTPSALLVLPHFNGSGTPWCDMKSKGAILGLDLSTSRHDIARAIIESQSYELRINVELMANAGVVVSELRAVGGGAKSPLWLQIKADVLNRPISALKTREAACLGAALLAGTATGVFPSLEAAVQQNVSIEKEYFPAKPQAAWYEERFKVYREVYPTLAPIHRKL